MDALEFPDDAKKKILTSTLKPGELLVWKDFEFADGTKKDKLVLILSNCIKGSIFIVTLPTSKIEGYVDGRRSFVDTVCFPKGQVRCFNRDTIVDLKNLMRVKSAKLSAQFGKCVKLSKTEMPKDAMEKILEAVKNAKTLTPSDKKEILEA